MVHRIALFLSRYFFDYGLQNIALHHSAPVTHQDQGFLRMSREKVFFCPMPNVSPGGENRLQGKYESQKFFERTKLLYL